jgi:hypothetical protein
VTVRSEILPLIGELVSVCEGKGWVSHGLPEAEEVPDLLLGGLMADALDVDGVGHICGVFEG